MSIYSLSLVANSFITRDDFITMSSLRYVQSHQLTALGTSAVDDCYQTSSWTLLCFSVQTMTS